ncbi:MAG: cation-translocating P-type ATPase, partial [Gemmatimonadota bacterium]
GLAGAEVEARRNRHGPNRLREHERRGGWEILVAQLKSVIVALLAAAAAVSFVFGSPVEGTAIVGVLVINTLIGFFTELRAVHSMESLREMSEVPADVVRDGSQRRIPAREVVPGDMMVVEGGDVVTADVRLVRSSRLQADESALTGESVPVEKSPEPVPEDVPLAERTSMLYKGTAITRGSGVGVVTGTGMGTELGHVSELVEEATDESTPLERQLARLGRRLVWITLALAAVVAVGGIVAGRDPLLIVETALALAVAAIPEGLPIVATLALARGMYRMARRNALVERLSAVETLGSTTVILTDKTGTLTENRMTVTRVALPGETLDLADGDAGFDDGSAARSPVPGPASGRGGTEPAADEAPVEVDPSSRSPLARLLRAAVLCNDANLAGGDADGEADVGEEGDASATGDPTEIALLFAGDRAGLTRRDLLERWPEVEREAFDPEKKMMATIHRDEDGGGAVLVAVKGAPEAVLDACDRVAGDEEDHELSEDARGEWLDRSEALAADGLRVLALAERRADDAPEDPFGELTLLGLVGLLDPPRADVRGSIARCDAAGVRVVMVTGDHPDTARNVAEAVGIGGENALTGADVGGGGPGDSAWRDRVLRAGVVARASPEQKLRLLGLHQDDGQVAAMIGDGVNDAPALQKADIGVAMGERGTQVAREAADIILQDDRFGTIVEAVDQGRSIFANIRKFVVYLLSCNVSEILVVTLATLANAPLPILPLQILFLNLVTDVFPALALGGVEGSPRLMERPPRDPEEPVLTDRHWRSIAGYGAVLTASVLAGLAIAVTVLEMPTSRAVTVSFLILAFGQLWHVFDMAEPESGVLWNEVSRSPLVWGAVVLCVGILLAAVYVAPMARLLDVHRPGAAGWIVVGSLSLTTVVVGRAWAGVRSLARGR